MRWTFLTSFSTACAAFWTLGFRWTGKTTDTSGRSASQESAVNTRSSPPSKFSRRCPVASTTRRPAASISSRNGKRSSSERLRSASRSMRSLTVSSASMTVLPVTSMRSAAMPSRIRLSRDCVVGAKCRSDRQLASLRFISSGQGEWMFPVRSPASTWPTGTRA